MLLLFFNGDINCIQSFQIQLKWSEHEIPEDIYKQGFRLNRFSVVKVDYEINIETHGNAQHSEAVVRFTLKREYGYYMYQVSVY